MRRDWWIKVHGMLCQDWALLQPVGRVLYVDDLGRITGESVYGSRSEAIQALRRQAFERLDAEGRRLIGTPQNLRWEGGRNGR